MGLEIGPLHVRRSILIRAQPARVWREFESFDHMVRWFGLGHELHSIELAPGGRVDLSIENEGRRVHYGGRVVALEAGRELSFESNWEGDGAWPVPTFFTLRLTPVYDGTLVELFHHGFERLGAAAADELEGYEQGWGMNHLTALRRIVEGSGEA